MSKRTSVLTVIISSFLFLAAFFVFSYSRTVKADNKSVVLCYMNGNNKECFLPEKGTNLDSSGKMYDEAYISRFNIFEDRQNMAYVFHCRDGSNVYTFDGDPGYNIFPDYNSYGTVYYVSYRMSGDSEFGYSAEIEYSDMTRLFNNLNVDYSNDVFSVDLSSVRRYAILGDCSIEVQGIDPGDYYLSNEVLYVEKEGRVGWNDLVIVFRKSDGAEYYTWRVRKKIVPSLLSVTLDGTEITPDGLAITNGHHSFSIDVFQYNGCSSMELTVTDITNGKRLCDSVLLSGSLGTYSGTFDIDEVPVGHKLSYTLVLRYASGGERVFTDGNVKAVAGSYSFYIKPKHNLSSWEIKANDRVGSNGDRFSISFDSDIVVHSISSEIEGINLRNNVPETKTTASNKTETWYTNADRNSCSYYGTVTDVDSLRYLRIKQFIITFEDGKTDYYDDTYFYDKSPVIYPAFYADVLKCTCEENALSEDSKLEVKLDFGNYSIDPNCKVSPVFKITTFSKTSTGFPASWTKPITSEISSLDGNNQAIATIQLSDIDGFFQAGDDAEFYISISDPAGQTYNVKIESGYRFIGKFIVNSAELTTSNTSTYTDSNTTYHYTNRNDTLNLTFNSNHTVSSCTVYVGGTDYHFGASSIRSEGSGAYSVRLKNINFESGKPIKISRVSFNDIYSQKAEITENSIDFNNIIFMGDYDAVYNSRDFSKNSPRYLTSQGLITFILSSEKDDREIKITDFRMEYSNPDGQSKSVSLPVDSSMPFLQLITRTISMQTIIEEKEKYKDFSFDELDLSFYITVEDRSGLEAYIEINPSYCHYYDALDKCVELINIETPDDRSYVKNGDLLKFKFSSKHPLSDPDHKDNNGNYMLDGTLNGDKIVYLSRDQYNWEASYTIPDDNKLTDKGLLTLTAELFDQAHNQPYTLTTVDRNVYYYAPISINDLEFVSSNSHNSRLANNYDKVTISFKTDHILSSTKCVIGDKKFDLTCKAGEGYYGYEATGNIRDLKIDDNADIFFSLELSDAAGNTASISNGENTPNVRYYAPIAANDFKAQSNNGNGYLVAKNGDVITVSFNTTHPVGIVTATIAGKMLILSSTNSDRMHWSATFTVPDNIVPDSDMIEIKIRLGDDSGNNIFETGSKDIKYYDTLTVSDVSITTDNAKDSSKYAVDGNTVTVSFTTNHKINTTACSFELMSEKDMKVTEEALANGSYKYTYSRKISNGELNDQAGLTFAFSVTDNANNTPVVINENSPDTNNRITYFSPLEINTSIASDNANNSYAKNGDTITVTAAANHAATVVSASAFGRDMTVTGNGTASLTLVYPIPAAEKELKEGAVNTSVSFTDAAGNTYSSDKTDTGSVIYDRTKPKVIVGNVISGFTASDIAFDIRIEDDNIDKSKTGVEVNGKNNTIGNGLKENGTVYTMTVKNSVDGNITVVVTATDLAGNAATPFKTSVTVDKTNPKISTTTLYSSSNKIFKPGLVIADLFDIEEKNISNIKCTVSDGSSVTEWDVNTPLVTDGKKTITLVAVDKAGNSSGQLVLDVYIDGTAPDLIIKDTLTSKVLTAGTNEFDKSAVVSFELKNLSYDPDSPDKFKTLKIVKPDGSTVDLLADSTSQTGTYTYEFNDAGTYEVIVEATDDLGNTTGEIRYELVINGNVIDEPENGLTDEISEDKISADKNTKDNNSKSGISIPGLVAVISIAAVFVAALAAAIVYSVKKNRK